jgi:hypothetical protein
MLLALLTPRSHHVEVENGGNSSKERAPLFQGFYPAKECEHEEENGDCFVIVRPSNRSGNVAGHNANEGGSKKACALVLHLLSEPGSMVSTWDICRAWRYVHVSCPGRQCAESRSKQDADVTDINRQV